MDDCVVVLVYFTFYAVRENHLFLSICIQLLALLIYFHIYTKDLNLINNE